MTLDLSNRRIISFTLRLMYPVPTRNVIDKVVIHDFNTASDYTIGSPYLHAVLFCIIDLCNLAAAISIM
jgi:hypothetical protein